MNREEILAQIKRFFDVEELVCDHTFAKWGEKSWQFLDTNFLHCLLIIRRDILKVPMYCNGRTAHQKGLRCNMCQLVKEKKAVYLSSHCFDTETEVLTTDGWKHHNEIKDSDTLYSLNMDTMVVEKKPVAFITEEDYKGKMVSFKNTHIDVFVTDAHDVILRYTPDKYVRVSDHKYSERGQAYFDSLKTDNDKWHKEAAAKAVGKRRHFMCAAKVCGETTPDLPFLKFCMATIADGFFQYKNGTPGVGFRFKKDRKCQQIESLLSELGWDFAKHMDKAGVWNYYIRSCYAKPVLEYIGAKKLIPLSILDFGGQCLRELVEYYAWYDGCHSKRQNDIHYTISTSVLHNAEMLQLMSALGGMRCSASKKPASSYTIRGKSGMGKESYHLTINPNIDSSRLNEKCSSVMDYEGKVWCVTNENGTVITRRNGKITILGNCLGKAGDFTSPSMKAEKMRELIKANAHLLPCPIRMEAGVSWLHFDVLPQYGITQKVYEFKA